jgi:hypothetical protein
MPKHRKRIAEAYESYSRRIRKRKLNGWQAGLPESLVRTIFKKLQNGQQGPTDLFNGERTGSLL